MGLCVALNGRRKDMKGICVSFLTLWNHSIIACSTFINSRGYTITTRMAFI
jgi:hypothetical protein